MDIKPPRKRPLNTPVQPMRSSQSSQAPVAPDFRTVHNNEPPVVQSPRGDDGVVKSVDTAVAPGGDAPTKRRRSPLLWAIGALVGFIILIAVSAAAWYFYSLTPVSSSTDRTRITIESGMAPTQIGAQLHEQGLIRSPQAFELYTKISGTRNQLKAGSYAFSPAQSTEDIVAILVSGKTETLSVLLYPGGTLRDKTDKPESQKTDVYSALTRAGYSAQEVEAALNKHYDHPLLADKPTSASLEGYIYGDTYVVDSGASVEAVLKMTFDEYYRVITENNLIDGFKKQGLSLHQGIIMASVIQSEMGAQQKDMAQVAQIFFKRYKAKMPLGSDVTAYYGADLLGVPRAVTVDTPYNTRIHTGLPKGPISSPGLAALKAVASPAAGNYVYFLSGDDGKTYFATTNEQHEKNIVDHCKVGCSIP